VIAQVVERASGRAVCLALAAALERFGAPEELLTDNGKQFTARFAATGGEAPFDKICRKNGITHRLTQPRSPTTTGKIERFHQTLRRELLDDAAPFVSVLAAQAALDDWVRAFQRQAAAPIGRPRGAGHPAERFQPAPAEQRELLPLWLPGALEPVSAPQPEPAAPTRCPRPSPAGRSSSSA
jgi:transposase InsO family protein